MKILSSQSRDGPGAMTSREPLVFIGVTTPAIHGFDQARGAVVADLQPALHGGDRGAAAFQ